MFIIFPKYFSGPFVNPMIWSNIPRKFSVILWMLWGPSSSHYFLYQAQGIHQWHQTKLVKLCPYSFFFFFVMITLEFIWFDTILYFSIHLGDSSRQASFQVCYTKWFYICICIMERTAHSQQSSSPTYLYLLIQAPWFATFLREIMRAVFLISD